MGVLPHSSSRVRRLQKSTLWALLGSVLLALIYGRAALFDMNSGVIGGHSDGYQNLWNNYWVKTALFDLQTNPFFTNHIYYPTGTSLRFHTLNPLNGIITMPANMLWGYVTGINLLFLLALILTAFFSFLLIRDIVGSSWAAFAGAAIFTCANPRVVLFFNQGQSEKLSAQWLPLYLFFMWRALRPGSGSERTIFGVSIAPLPSAAAVLALLFASLTDWQYVLYAVQVSIIYLGFLAFSRHSVREKVAAFIRLSLIGVGYALIAGPLLILPMIIEALNSPWLSVSYQSQLHALDLMDFIGMGLGNPGYLALILGVVGVLSTLPTRNKGSGTRTSLALKAVNGEPGETTEQEKPRVTLFWILIALFGFVMALGPELIVNGNRTGVPLPYALLQNLSVFNVGRDPGRYTTLSTLGIAVLAAFGIRSLLTALRGLFIPHEQPSDLSPAATKSPSKLRNKAAAFLLTLTIVGVTIFPFAAATGAATPSQPEWTPFYQTLAQDGERYAILELPAFTEAGRGESYYMSLQSLHGKDRFSGRLARDRKLTNPNNFMKRAPLFRPLWLLSFPAQRREHYYPERDFLATTDYARYGLPILNYFKVRYLVLYKDAITSDWDRVEFDRLMTTIFGSSPEAHYEDSLMTAYAVPQATGAEAGLTLEVGDGWFASEVRGDGVPYRLANLIDELPPSLYVLNLYSTTVEANLTFTVYSVKEERTVRVSLDETTLETIKVTPAPAQVKVPLTLKPGFNAITFSSPEPPLPTGNHEDPRLLSFGMYEVVLDR